MTGERAEVSSSSSRGRGHCWPGRGFHSTHSTSAQDRYDQSYAVVEIIYERASAVPFVPLCARLALAAPLFRLSEETGSQYVRARLGFGTQLDFLMDSDGVVEKVGSDDQDYRIPMASELDVANLDGGGGR